ncbi:MAG: radical SAM family heme chaperone HemW [Desulfovibrionales bacterium]
MLLYIHFPFCRTKCGYCGFFSLPYSEVSCREYFDLLLQEIAHRAKMVERPVKSVYIGGGTPSLLGADRLEMLLQSLFTSFEMTPEPEVTLEVNPESALKTGVLNRAARTGVTRLSLGVQSLDNADLARLGRIHSREEAIRSYRLARECGFSNINLDLIWALPGQTLSSWCRILEEAMFLGPEHLSCYGLTIEPDTVFAAKFDAGSLDLPPEDVQSGMFLEGSRLLREQGFVHYEISSFCRPGFASRHNMGYWSGEEYLGFGPGAVSTFGDKRWETPAHLLEYGSWVTNGLPDLPGEILTPSIRIAEQIMLALRTSQGLDLHKYTALSGKDLLQEHQQLISMLLQQQLIELGNGFLCLTEKGMLVSNSVIRTFLST